jgi:hypothetical protein
VVSGVQFLEAVPSDISRQEVQLPYRVVDHLIHIVAVGFVQDVGSVQARTPVLQLVCLSRQRSYCTAGGGKVSTRNIVPFAYDFVY